MLVVAAAAIVALALYRLLSRTSGLDLRAGWATVGIAFAAACAVMLVAPGVLRVGLRRWRWMRASDDVSRAHAAWREFQRRPAGLGVGCAPSEPPRTLASRVTAELPEPAADAVRRTRPGRGAGQLRGTPGRVGAPAAGRRRGPARPRRDGAARRRWRARIFPASVMTTLADSAARIPDRLAALPSHRRLGPSARSS